MYCFRSTKVNNRCPILFAVLGEYPALIAASVALPLIRYSSQNFLCLAVKVFTPFENQKKSAEGSPSDAFSLYIIAEKTLNFQQVKLNFTRFLQKISIFFGKSK
nr:MAG TPA: hypothetical protein [Caudoviricetes sp.]